MNNAENWGKWLHKLLDVTNLFASFELRLSTVDQKRNRVRCSKQALQSNHGHSAKSNGPSIASI